MTSANQSTTCELRSTPDHLRPLDAVLVALEETSCTWCQGLLTLLKAHLEATNVPAFGQEVLN